MNVISERLNIWWSSNDDKHCYRCWLHFKKLYFSFERGKRRFYLALSFFFDEDAIGIHICNMYFKLGLDFKWYFRFYHWLHTKLNYEPWIDIGFYTGIDDSIWKRPYIHFNFLTWGKFIYFLPNNKIIKQEEKNEGIFDVTYRFKDDSQKVVAKVKSTHYTSRMNIFGLVRNWRRVELAFDPPVGTKNYKWYNIEAKEDENGYNDCIYTTSVFWPPDKPLKEMIESACDNSGRSVRSGNLPRGKPPWLLKESYKVTRR